MMNSRLSFSDIVQELNGDTWAEEVLKVIRSISHSKASFSADDIVNEMQAIGIEKERLHAIPSVLKKALNKGWIDYERCTCGEQCRTIKSKREGNNGRQIMLYRSRFF